MALRQDGTYAPADLRAIWGRWAGRERAFYEAAAGIVESLSWREILERAGPQVRLRAGLVREAHARLRAPAVPEGPLRRSPFVATTVDSTAVRLTTYSNMDPITIPRALFDVLPHFDERAAAPAIAAIEAAQGLEIDLDVVGRLVDFQVLVPAQKTTDAAPEGSPPRTPARTASAWSWASGWAPVSGSGCPPSTERECISSLARRPSRGPRHPS